MRILNWLFGNKMHFDLLDAKPIFLELEKIKAVLSNPALLKVFALQCDLFSLGEIFVKDKDGNLIDDDPFIKLINNPNPFEERSDFLWNYMFNLMMGNAYCYATSSILENELTRIYNLDSWRVEIPEDLLKLSDKILESNSSITNILKKNIRYIYEDGEVKEMAWGKIIHVADLGVGSRFQGASRIDALRKIVANSEAALDSENINIRYSGKFMVAGKSDLGNVNHMPMHEDEKRDIEDKMLSKKTVHAVKSMIDIKRFVEDARKLELDKKYLNAYYLIGKAYSIPRDVLEAYDSSTFENQEKARGAHVSYSLQPKGNALMNGFERMFGYQEQGKDIFMSWENLPFMQVFANQKAETKRITIDTFVKMKNSGLAIDEINDYLGTNFSDEKGERK